MINDTTTFLRRARIAQPVITAKVLIFKWSKLHPDRCTDDKSVTSLYTLVPEAKTSLPFHTSPVFSRVMNR